MTASFADSLCLRLMIADEEGPVTRFIHSHREVLGSQNLSIPCRSCFRMSLALTRYQEEGDFLMLVYKEELLSFPAKLLVYCCCRLRRIFVGGVRTLYCCMHSTQNNSPSSFVPKKGRGFARRSKYSRNQVSYDERTENYSVLPPGERILICYGLRVIFRI